MVHGSMKLLFKHEQFRLKYLFMDFFEHLYK